MSTIGALQFTASQVSSLLGLSSPAPSIAGGLGALFDASPSDPSVATDNLLAALAPASTASGDTGLASLFGPATIVDPGTAGILETIAQADSATDTAIDQTLPSADQSGGQDSGQSSAAQGPAAATGSPQSVDISA